MKTRAFGANLLPLLALMTLFAAVTIVSCRKTETTAARTNSESGTQFVNSTNFAHVNSDLDDKDFDDAFADSGDCKTVTFDTSKDVYPHTKTITYNNCFSECKDGVLNGTKVVYNYVNPDSADAGDLIKEVTYQDFTIDSVKVSGDVKVYLVASAPYTLHIVATRTLVVSGKDGVTETVKTDHIRTQIAGGDTEDRSDDVYSVTGTSSGHENMHGGQVAKYSAMIDANDRVIKAADCCWRSSGTETVTIDVNSRGTKSTLTEVLDYGDGSCDNQATLSVNGGEPQTVTLPLRFWPLNP